MSFENELVGAPTAVTAVTELVKNIPPATITAEPTKRTQLIYCGPNLKGGILNQYTVYRGDGLPKHLDQHIADCPAIRRLFVAMQQLQQATETCFRNFLQSLRKGCLATQFGINFSCDSFIK